ncbi:Serine/threonine-protein kinase MARK2 [Galemys pyrenaicus]|uniref:non-specific serine/threonine protein kinase n=1 Tax=Galemys pyrenaicus TaxID=202257 RepID=A0A8J6DSV5_GALPY|nr:Serine/threonine-protein kinase MARK2 [Galemys pyrenaicus]
MQCEWCLSAVEVEGKSSAQGGHAQVGASVLDTGINGRRHEDARTVRTDRAVRTDRENRQQQQQQKEEAAERELCTGLKLENLLLDRHNKPKMADFSFSVQCSNEKVITYCGSPEYTAPEVCRHHRHHGPTVDIWSLGVILYRMVTGKLPFVEGTFWKLRRCIISGSFHMPAYLPDKCKDLLRKVLVLDPERRSKVEDLMKHHGVKCRRNS